MTKLSFFLNSLSQNEAEKDFIIEDQEIDFF